MIEERPTLHTMVKNASSQSPYQVRHLLIDSRSGSSATKLIQLISGRSTQIGSGTEYEMNQKANELMSEWAHEGFRRLREREQAWEDLRHTITLALLMGYQVIYDPECKDVRAGNLMGVVPLAQWPGKRGKKGGGYHYAFTGATILAVPKLPPGHGINMAPSSQEFVRTMQQAIALQKAVGPDFELVLG